MRVRIDDAVWDAEVGRFGQRSPARIAAERELPALRERGVDASRLLACEAEGQDGTALPGLVKVYVPITDSPPSARPYGLVFKPGAGPDGATSLAVVAFGERHPKRGVKSVYQRAHKALHGHYP